MLHIGYKSHWWESKSKITFFLGSVYHVGFDKDIRQATIAIIHYDREIFVGEILAGEKSGQGITRLERFPLGECPLGKVSFEVCPLGSVTRGTVQLRNCPTLKELSG